MKNRSEDKENERIKWCMKKENKRLKENEKEKKKDVVISSWKFLLSLYFWTNESITLSDQDLSPHRPCQEMLENAENCKRVWE